MKFLNIIKDKYLFGVFALSLSVFFITSLIFSFFFITKSGPIAIHYNPSLGIIDFVGNRFHILGILATGFVAILINMILSNFLYFRERFLSYMFGFFSLAFSILILMVLSAIISLN